MAGWVVLVVAASVLAEPARAEESTELSSSQARTAQYVFVIDDSGSMSRRVGGQPAADPDRLAVFAARSTLSMLDDVDEATVVRLNGPGDADSVAPIAPLADNRGQLEASLSLDGPLAAYGGQKTPCGRALSAVKKALNAAYRPNVAQVVMFLTDGQCTGPTPSPGQFLDGLKSADDSLFKFYLLRFEGRDYTPALAKLAHQSGATAIKASATDPTAILEPFASALSRSQGYESYLLTPQDHLLEAHRGARRVRLLAVAPDKGEPLDFSVEPARKGKSPKLIGSTRTGLHQFDDGRRYRYAALDYKPGTAPVSVTVSGAGRDWKVVAVPEYRLFVDMDIHQGKCGQGGPSINYAEVGATICAAVRLINARGDAVTTAVAGHGSEALIRYTPPGEDSPHELPANRPGQDARFVIERANLVEGDHIFRPAIRLAVPGQAGETITIRGAAQTLQVTSMNIAAKPGRVDFDTLVPGQEQFSDVQIAGNFPASKARLTLQNRDDVPECVHVSLGDKPEGAAQKITAGQTYQLGVHVDPYCGAASFKRDIQTAVRVEFDPSGQLLRVPTLVIPIHFALVDEISATDTLEAHLKAGESAQLGLTVDGNFNKDAAFKALIPPADERETWPSDADDLRVEFLADDGQPIYNADDEPALAAPAEFGAGASPDALGIRVVSDACCGAATYRTEVALVPTAGTKEPIRVPVVITVEAAGAWSCWGGSILWALGLLLALLVILYIYNIFRNSSFLSPTQLVNQLQVLEWGATGRPTATADSARKVQYIVDKHFGVVDRARAWFSANPLMLGLPNDRTYDETIRLALNAEQPRLTQLKVLGGVGHYDKLTKHPVPQSLVYASKARGFYGVADLDGYIGAMHVQDYMAPPTGDLEVVDLRGVQLVVDDRDRPQGDPAGWEIGY